MSEEISDEKFISESYIAEQISKNIKQQETKEEEPKDDSKDDSKDKEHEEEHEEEPKEEEKQEDDLSLDDKYKATEEEARNLGIDQEKLNIFIANRAKRIREDRLESKVQELTKAKDEEIEKLSTDLVNLKIENLIAKANISEDVAKVFREQLQDTGLSGEKLIKYAEKYMPKASSKGGENEATPMSKLSIENIFGSKTETSSTFFPGTNGNTGVDDTIAQIVSSIAKGNKLN